MDFKTAKDYIESLAHFQSVLGLDNIQRLLEKLGNPEKNVRVIHVAGTNGKGSTIAFIENILRNCGLNVGKYTSPVVFEYLEKIKINGENISQEDFSFLVEKIKYAMEKLMEEDIYPTIFETETAMAFLYFSVKKCDVAIIETGMGGDSDATNVIETPLLSVITSVSMDHMTYLGSTIEEIATHKAGIIKGNCPVVISNMDNMAQVIFISRAKSLNSDYRVDRALKKNKKNNRYSYVSSNNNCYNDIELAMQGSYQRKNAALAIEAIEILVEKYPNIINNDGTRESKDLWKDDTSKYNKSNLENYICDGLQKAILPGRFEKISNEPDIYIDGAHNVDAVVELSSTIDTYFKGNTVTFIIGVLSDKDYEAEIEIIGSKAKNIVTITPNNTRGLDGEILRKKLLKVNCNVVYADTMEKAINIALSYRNDVVLAFGSLSYLRELRDTLRG